MTDDPSLPSLPTLFPSLTPRLLHIHRHRRTNEHLDRRLVDLIALVNIDGAPRVAGLVSRAQRSAQRCAADPGPRYFTARQTSASRKLRLAGADDAAVRPHRHATHVIRGLAPFHLFDRVRVGRGDESADAGDGDGAPGGKGVGAGVDRPRGSVSSSLLRSALRLVHAWYLFPS